MIYSQKILNSDLLGALVGSLCLIHCLATPLLFVAKACSTSCCSDSPIWWKAIDYFFILISFIAIVFSTKKLIKKWLVIALWSSWFLLLITILSEALGIGLFPTSFIYLPSVLIIAFHYYNIRYCKCGKEIC